MAVDLLARRFSIEWVIRNAKDKLFALQQLSTQSGFSLIEMCYVGDGDRDAMALSQVGLGLAPANATQSAKAAAHRVLSHSGGAGAVAEAIMIIQQQLSLQKKSTALEIEMRTILTDSQAAHKQMMEVSLPILVQIAQVLISAIRNGRKVLLFGNGGSAADAQHVAAELVGRFFHERQPWPAIALSTNTSILTAVGNDWDFSDIFTRQVRALARNGDIVVGISTSGNSLNVVRGLQTGREQGAITIGFTGLNGGNVAINTDLCFCAPHYSTPRIQELHILAWHAICQILEEELIAANDE